MHCPSCGDPRARFGSPCPACGVLVPLPPPGQLAQQVQPRFPKTAPLATASVILGASGFVACFVFSPLMFFTALAAVMTGHVARSQIRRSNGELQGNDHAVAGLILGYLQLAFVTFGLLLAGLVLVLK